MGLERASDFVEKARSLRVAHGFCERLGEDFEPTEDVAGKLGRPRHQLDVVDGEAVAIEQLGIFLG